VCFDHRAPAIAPPARREPWGACAPCDGLHRASARGTPPPPPQWLDDISQIVGQLNLATRMEGNVGGAVQHAALATPWEQLGALRALKAQQAH
jgi:hypothetical protein